MTDPHDLHAEVVVMPPLADPLPITLSNALSDRIGQLGRAEDIRFSPDGSRLAIAGFKKGSCLVLGVRVSDGPKVTLTSALEITSDALREPHGFDFIGNDRLVVANRGGAVTVFRLPAQTDGEVTLKPETVIARMWPLAAVKTPGSVVAFETTKGRIGLLVCQNYAHQISFHEFKVGQRWLPVRGRIALTKGLDIPDGIATTPGQKLVAVSSHNTHEVLIYDWKPATGPETKPVARLTGVEFPHGLRFSEGGARLFVADAGSPAVYVFERPEWGWMGDIAPVSAFAPISEAVFRQGRHNPQEGGPKGVDIDPSGRVLAVTNEVQPLAFFDVSALTTGPVP
jgi:DNA-binding beta-propeller fold protein YncE